ncbi:tRNA (N6-threonylcarbamoyladenosine(37)-N6)-methyltransferase TrmO [Desulfosarcina widdelii]|uniref:tRNA (N6-threonylcarbamoyladenosine(37)-N6)-methyltransferase TrmO n=1 Tax=Desulfosarcina widdelii TaxID=947919 RepID=A0A5K7Z0Y8_9BACT|nr:tRNA (N6-threonylcarbamoyladenosine(37)-N6)-methyltransferase TrmO [Desulfosarcina widdelii]BBO74568.1 tRNA (N6-threonylcarbamoyladenosine(37)-N6)-methyltransferase TrmO [Desulfosarcina widdelii]
MKEPSPTIEFSPIGIIRTPYENQAPYQPIVEDQGEFRIEVFPAYSDGLFQLARFHYIYVICQLHKSTGVHSLSIKPPWTTDTTVGIFASRSPKRPNRIGLSIVRLERIEENVLHTSGIDVFDGTPLLDIKPYIQELDVKPTANYGWLDDLDDRDHLMLHIKGIAHES